MLQQRPLARRYAGSLCHSCQGCRYVLGKRAQLYFLCELSSTRYPVQPQLSCERYQASATAWLSLPSEGATPYLTRERLVWVGPPLGAPLRVRLGAPQLFAELFGEGEPLPAARPAPRSALMWLPDPAREGTGQLTWTEQPQKGHALAWSERVLSLRAGQELSLSGASS